MQRIVLHALSNNFPFTDKAEMAWVSLTSFQLLNATMNITTVLFLTILISVLGVDSVLEGLKCPFLTIKKGRVRFRSKSRIAKFTCFKGFQLLGDRYSTCLRGRWDTPAPVCISEGCFPVGDIPHGQTYESYRGALVKFQCDPGFMLIGSPVLYCNSISWNGTVPICKEITTKAQKWCDFEAEDLCGWTHDVTHDFDWRRHNFATPSGHVGTGPAYDHTLGPFLDGHYMYLEASNPRLENDTARLFSPVFPASSNDSCFIFWYHMYGATIGSLQVYLHAQSISPLFTESGNHGNQWLKAIIPLPPINSSFQIVIEGVRGAGYIGDTAIDDVKLTEGDECSDEPITVSILGSCEGRCHSNATTDVSACDCTVDCIDNSTCCSDFLTMCGMVTTKADQRFNTALDSSTNQPVQNTSSQFSSNSSDSASNVTTTFVFERPKLNINSTTVTNRIQSSTPQTSTTPVTLNLIQNTKPILTTTPFMIISTRANLTTNTPARQVTFIPWPKITITPQTLTPTLIPNLTTPEQNDTTTLITNRPNLTSKSPFYLKPFTFFPRFQSITPRSNLSLITNKMPVFIHPPPPPIVYRTPQIIMFTKYSQKPSTLITTTITPPTTKTIALPNKIPQYKVEQNMTKNNVINPFWDKVKPPQPPTLGPIPDKKLPKLFITTISFPTKSTLASDVTIIKKRYKSKYKRLDFQAQVRSNNKRFTAGIAAALGLVALFLVASVAAICYVRRRRINRGATMDGEGDVLFFTTDEILDFTLARPSSEPSVCETQR